MKDYSLQKMKLYDYEPEKARSRYAGYLEHIRRVLIANIGKLRLLGIAASIMAIAGALFFYLVYVRVPATSVSVRIVPSEFHIGDPVKYMLKVVSAPDIRARFPEGQQIKGFDIKCMDKKESAVLNRKVTVFVLDITGYSAGKHTVISPDIEYSEGDGPWKVLRAHDVTVKIIPVTTEDDFIQDEKKTGMSGDMAGFSGAASGDGSLRASGSGSVFGVSGGGKKITMASRRRPGREVDAPIRYRINDIRPPKEIRTFKDNALRTGIYIAMVVAGGFIVLVLIGLLTGKGALREQDLSDKVLKRMKRMKARIPEDNDGISRFCRALNVAIMGYVAQRYGLRSVQRTAREFMSELEMLTNITPVHKNMLKERVAFLEIARYSGKDVDRGLLTEVLEEFMEFVQKTRPAEEEEE